MQRARLILGLLILISLISIFGLHAPSAQADAPVVAKVMPSPAAASFQHFCKDWMKKLDEREVRNRSLAKAVSNGNELVMHYTGYGKTSLKCEVRETGVPSQPFVGRLVYDEIEYQKAGATPSALSTKTPSVRARTEVMEIFRYDGKKWVY